MAVYVNDGDTSHKNQVNLWGFSLENFSLSQYLQMRLVYQMLIIPTVCFLWMKKLHLRCLTELRKLYLGRPYFQNSIILFFEVSAIKL